MRSINYRPCLAKIGLYKELVETLINQESRFIFIVMLYQIQRYNTLKKPMYCKEVRAEE